MYHYDGTTEFTSRGAGGVNQKALLQRIPADQLCGATMLLSVTTVIQDQSGVTPEGPVTLEVRGDDTINSPRPDMVNPPICSLPLGIIAFPGAGVSAMKLTITLAAPCLLPQICPSPQGDFYLGFGLPAAPAWPADGISVHISANELMCPTCVPYGANPTLGSPVHATNLGWDVGYVAGVPTNIWLGTLNRAWRIGGRYREDTLQPCASNARFSGGGAGLNPNYGYAGICPDASLGDALGFNVQSSLPIGSPYFLLVGPETCPGLVLPPNLLTPDSSLVLCILPWIVVGPSITVAPGPCLRDPGLGGVETCVSQADFGPFALPFLTCGNNGSIYAQGVGLAGGLLQVSTSCRVDL
ncbi:MAG: hypothetical protein HZB39_02030 [Planctomycetes bacterium]|nr:hypothetical protein [Planctomycetota bacterium]